MADISILMVADGNRFNFGPQQNPAGPEDDLYFGLTALTSALKNSTTPSFQVDFAHRRGFTYAGSVPGTHEDCSAGLTTYQGDFVFANADPAKNQVTADLTQYDVLWLIGDEGYNGTVIEDKNVFSEITDPEKIAIAEFMGQFGGGVFAVGDHDGIGAYMCGKLPRIRLMRRWFEWDHPYTDPVSGQKLITNWSNTGTGRPGETDRNDTLRPDSADGLYYFFDQSDPTPQPLLDATGNPLTASSQVHTILRTSQGAVIGFIPDHMHEGEATDFTTVASPRWNPNKAPNTPYEVEYQDSSGKTVSFPEFPIPYGYQPTPQVIAYDQDLGHVTYYDTSNVATPPYPMTQPKVGPAAVDSGVRGAISIYDGRTAGVGRIVTGSTFHHYLDKNLLGDPGTASTTAGMGPTGSELGLPASDVTEIGDYYINVATWLARPSTTSELWTIKNTFGADEVASAEAQQKTFQNAFFLVLNDMAPAVVGAMPSITLSGSLADAGAVFIQETAIPEDNSQPTQTQRILIPFTVVSIPANAFPTGSTPTLLVLEARATINNVAIDAEGVFELVAGANPYFSNFGGGADEQWWLSQDLRVFQAGPNAPVTPFVNWPASGSGYDYITALLGFLNDPSNGYTTGSDPFTTLNEANDLTEASSVTPQVHNFAVARVRLHGSKSTTGGVKAFFRLWTAATNDTDYDPQRTYLSTSDTAGLPDKPLPATGLNTPLYATGQTGAQDYDPGVNQSDIAAPADPNSETWHYFGCYLDVYNNPSVSLIGTHHCLVAQIAYDGAPIEGTTGITLSPENTGKLAQRNIQITPSGNPGGPPAHRIPQAVDLRPSNRTGEPVGTLGGRPDELLIDWGDVPLGSTARLYWPQANAIDVVRLGMLLYSTDHLHVIDAHTVGIDITSRLTYVPVPFGSGGNLAGLFTIDLNISNAYGREFQVVVRRIRTRPALDRPPSETESMVSAAASRAAGKPRQAHRSRAARRGATSASRVMATWRYVVGTFQVTIPVSAEKDLLFPEENTLAILKWRLQTTPPSNRWYPVLRRYVQEVAGRVQAFGGNPAAIPPSPKGAPHKPIPKGRGEGLTGKIVALNFDEFGDFTGFCLQTEHFEHEFFTREKFVLELADRAWRERLRVTVVPKPHHRQHVRSIVFREPPAHLT